MIISYLRREYTDPNVYLDGMTGMVRTALGNEEDGSPVAVVTFEQYEDNTHGAEAWDTLSDIPECSTTVAFSSKDSLETTIALLTRLKEEWPDGKF